jgi:hypothetical protein
MVRATVAVAAAALAALATLQLARVDANLGSTFGPDRTQRTLDAMPLPEAARIAAAREVLDARPVDGRAYRTIALAEHQTNLLDTANARWPRDPLTRASLADRALAEGDVATGLEHFDALLRIAPGTGEIMLPLLMPHLHDARVRSALVDRLLEHPPWRTQVLSALRNEATPAADAETFLAALAAREPLDEKARETRIAVLDRAGRPADARSLWIASLPQDVGVGAGRVFDGGFEHPGVQGGYGWRFGDVPGVLIDYDTVSPRTGQSALAIEFEDRAIRFSAVRQALALAPGRYRMEAAARVDVATDRPFEWRITCSVPPKTGGQHPDVIARLPLAREDTWRMQSTMFVVPPNCMGQVMQLVHTARSLTERRLRGRLLLDDVGIFLGE